MVHQTDLGDKPVDYSSSTNPVIRKFINSAIYVEKPISISSSNTSVSQKFSSEDLSEDLLPIKTKRCTCSIDPKNCSCHINITLSQRPHPPPKPAKPPEATIIKTKLSQAIIPKEKPARIEPIKPVTATKKEKNKKEVKAEIKPQDKEVQLEEERKNFRKWLLMKKKSEVEAKKKKEKEAEDLEMVKLEKEKRQLENKLNFQLWLKKKEEAHLEKQIKEQLELITDLERKEKQIKENENAFSDWLKHTRARKKPLSSAKGMESLRSTSSISYVNPTPWNPIV